MKISTSVRLPASSFYRVEMECPSKPAGATVTATTGYPESELVFSSAGKYDCVVNFGILTKSSCAGMQYQPLGEYDFSIDIKPN